jgi:hypothetical protein
VTFALGAGAAFAFTGGALAFGAATFFISFCGAAFFLAVTAGLLAALGFAFAAFAAGRAFNFAIICLQSNRRVNKEGSRDLVITPRDRQ